LDEYKQAKEVSIGRFKSTASIIGGIAAGVLM
jgi:hypothetical protein